MLKLQAMRILCFLGACSMLSPGLLGQGTKKDLTVVTQWAQLEWAYPTEADRQHDIDTHVFVPGNGVLIDADVFYTAAGNSRIFATVPRFQGGIPGTLNVVTKGVYNRNPQLQPYPDWSWHRDSAKCNKNRIISVFRTQIDECGRLWVLDTGKIGDAQLCAPQILAFDMKTDKVIHRFEVPLTQIQSTSLLITPAVDVRDPGICSETFVYAADVTGFGIIVFDVRRNLSWRVQNKLMYPVPDYGTFTINGESFDLMDGILGLALSPLIRGEDRVLYFHSLASATENYVYTSVLRNQTLFATSPDESPRSFQVFSKKRPSQSAAQAMDKNGILYFGELRETAMACWNRASQFDQRNFGILERNSETLQFPSGVKIVNNRKTQELWVTTCRFQKVMTGTIDQKNEINFRIMAVKVDDYVAGSKCATPSAPYNKNPGGGYGLIKPEQIWDEVSGKNTSKSASIIEDKTSDSIKFLNN